MLEHLRAARFLIDDVEAESRRTHLLYVSLETCTSCNHRCPFCPVSVDPRDKEVMSQELFVSLVDQIVAAGGKQRRRLPLELQRADGRSALRGALPGPLRARSAGLDPDQRLALRSGPRRAARGGWGASATSASTCRRSIPSGTSSCTARRTSPASSRNVDAMRARALAEETAIVVLGDEDEAHRRDVEAIRERFEPQGLGRPAVRRSAAGPRAAPTCPSRRRRRSCAAAS